MGMSWAVSQNSDQGGSGWCRCCSDVLEVFEGGESNDTFHIAKGLDQGVDRNGTSGRDFTEATSSYSCVLLLQVLGEIPAAGAIAIHSLIQALGDVEGVVRLAALETCRTSEQQRHQPLPPPGRSSD